MLHGYVEPFAGSLGILLRRPPAAMELVNDLDGRIVNLWRVWRDHPDEWLRRLSFTPHSKAEYYRCHEVNQHPLDITTRADIDLAVATYVVIAQGMGRIGKLGWLKAVATISSPPRRVSVWPSEPTYDRIIAIGTRIRDVQLDCDDALKIISRSDTGTLVYCDPPYVMSSRNHNDTMYGNEPNDDWHREFLATCKASPAKIAISGYPTELYEGELADWQRFAFSALKHSQGRHRQGGSLDEAAEVLWMNYDYRDFESTAQAKLWGED